VPNAPLTDTSAATSNVAILLLIAISVIPRFLLFSLLFVSFSPFLLSLALHLLLYFIACPLSLVLVWLQLHGAEEPLA
jgi:hypothetical protein